MSRLLRKQEVSEPCVDLVEESERQFKELKTLMEAVRLGVVQLERLSETLMFQVAASAMQGIQPESFESLGGAAGVQRAVTLLYTEVMEDPDLAPYFRNADLSRIQKRQVDMFLTIFGIQDYQGTNLAVIHRPLNITSAHFDALLNHVYSVLREVGLGVQETLQSVEALRALETQIVGVP